MHRYSIHRYRQQAQELSTPSRSFRVKVKPRTPRRIQILSIVYPRQKLGPAVVPCSRESFMCKAPGAIRSQAVGVAPGCTADILQDDPRCSLGRGRRRHSEVVGLRATREKRSRFFFPQRSLAHSSTCPILDLRSPAPGAPGGHLLPLIACRPPQPSTSAARPWGLDWLPPAPRTPS